MTALSVSRILSAAATTNATSAKTTSGIVYSIVGYNAKASAVYAKFYDKASAPTVGTDTPKATIYLPATAGFSIPLDLRFTTGIAYALTGAGADNDTTALSAGDVLALNVIYE